MTAELPMFFCYTFGYEISSVKGFSNLLEKSECTCQTLPLCWFYFHSPGYRQSATLIIMALLEVNVSFCVFCESSFRSRWFSLNLSQGCLFTSYQWCFPSISNIHLLNENSICVQSSVLCVFIDVNIFFIYINFSNNL